MSFMWHIKKNTQNIWVSLAFHNFKHYGNTANNIIAAY